VYIPVVTNLILAGKARAEAHRADVRISEAEQHYAERMEAWMREDAELAREDDPGWEAIGRGATMGAMSSTTLATAREVSRKLYWGNPYVMGILGTLERSVFAAGYRIKAILPAVQTLWDVFARVNLWGRRFPECGRRAWLDGETFTWRITQREWPPRVRYAEPGAIRDPLNGGGTGIDVHPDDPETPIRYHHLPEGAPAMAARQIPAAEMQHTKILVDMATPRGVPLLWVARNWAHRLAKTHEAMSWKAWIAACHVLNKRYKGASPSRLATQREALEHGTKRLREATYSQQRVRPGMMTLTGDNVEYAWVNPGLGAMDQQIVARALGLALCAMVGLPEYMVLGDASNNNFASIQVGEKQAFTTIRYWQGFFAIELQILWDWLMSEAVRMGMLGEGQDTSVDIQAPAVQVADVAALVKAMNVAYVDGVLSKHTYAAAMGFDFERQQDLMDEELEADETGADTRRQPAPEETDEEAAEQGDEGKGGAT